jgi:SAM-dependent MidA family methyltransferase
VPTDGRSCLNMTNIRQIIQEAIAKSGPISFARFMGLALYCPDFGYYEQPDMSLGQKGDFFTSVSVGALYGQLLACRFAGWLGELNPERLQIVEAGAHDGRLAHDILAWLRTNRPDLARAVEYWIFEPSQNRRRSQEARLAEFRGQVRWFDAWHSLPAKVNGIIFCNELLDAMPVRRLGWDAEKKRWFEWGVAIQGDELVWARMPGLLSPDVCGTTVGNLPNELLNALPDGFTTESSSAAIDWWKQAADALALGKLIAIDYGLESEAFFAPERSAGTLRAYYRHHQNNDLLARPGEQDITAQLNFSVIRDVGEAAGLNTVGLMTQAKFLTAILEHPVSDALRANWTSKQTRQFQTLTHPEHLGRSFRVLIQSP